MVSATLKFKWRDASPFLFPEQKAHLKKKNRSKHFPLPPDLNNFNSSVAITKTSSPWVYHQTFHSLNYSGTVTWDIWQFSYYFESEIHAIGRWFSFNWAQGFVFLLGLLLWKVHDQFFSYRSLIVHNTVTVKTSAITYKLPACYSSAVSHQHYLICAVIPGLHDARLSAKNLTFFPHFILQMLVWMLGWKLPANSAKTFSILTFGG